MRVMLPWVIACTSGEEPVVDPPPNPQPRIVEAAGADVQWRAAGGFGLRAARVIGDVDGDGWVDASVISWPLGADWNVWDLLIVRGPLRRSLTLPGDHAASFAGAVVYEAGNAYDNGGSDIMLVDPDQVQLFDGPALLDGGDSLDELGVGIQDVDGDGVLDYVERVAADDTWGLWHGPATRWRVGKPDVQVVFDCPDEGVLVNLGGLHAIPDVTGDGVREAFSEAWLYQSYTRYSGQDLACQGLVYPLPEPGPEPVDVIADSEAAWGFFSPRYWQVVPDQTGDGVDDLLAEDVLYEAPVQFGAGGEILASAAFDGWPRNTADIEALNVDATGDGGVDFLGYADDVVWVLRGAPEEDAPPHVGIRVRDEVQVPGREQVFVEEGMTSLLVSLGTGVAVAELGPSL